MFVENDYPFKNPSLPLEGAWAGHGTHRLLLIHAAQIFRFSPLLVLGTSKYLLNVYLKRTMPYPEKQGKCPIGITLKMPGGARACGRFETIKYRILALLTDASVS